MTLKAPRSGNSFRKSLTGEELSSQLEPFDDFATFSDEDLVRVTREWRAKADRGDRDAFGVAHDCEVEMRRREKASESFIRSPDGSSEITSGKKPTPWWKFWTRGEC